MPIQSSERLIVHLKSFGLYVNKRESNYYIRGQHELIEPFTQKYTTNNLFEIKLADRVATQEQFDDLYLHLWNQHNSPLFETILQSHLISDVVPLVLLYGLN